MADVVEDFEDATLNITVTDGGNAAWARSSASAHAGSWSFKSGTITHSQTTDAIVDVPAGATTVQFWYRVSSESGFDFFRFLLGGTQQFQASGTVGWTQSAVYDVTAVSTITFRYLKDVSDTAGEDAAYVDDIVFTVPDPPPAGGASAAPILNVAVDFENNGTFVDISAYLMSLTIKRGSSRVEGPLIRYEAGTCELTLNNSDRRFDSTNLEGPYTLPSGAAASGLQQAVSNKVQTYGHGFTVACASTDPEVVEASLRDATVTTSSSTSFTATKPTLIAGDTVIALQTGDWGSASAMGTPTGGATWQLLTSRDAGTNALHSKIWWKVATAADVSASNYGFTQASDSDGVVIIGTIKDATGTPTFDSVDNHGTAFFDTPAIEPAGTADYELRFVAATGGGSGATWDWSGTDGPYTEAEDAQSGSFTTGSMAHKSLSGLQSGSGGTLVKPMRPVRVRAIWNSVTYDLFRGYVNNWHIDPDGPNKSVATVPCTDAFKLFSRFDRRSADAVSAPSELTSARINRILDNAGWPASLRSIATGDVTLQASTLNSNLMEELLLTNETEVGELYMTGDGKVFFRNRNAINNDARSTTSQATFGDGGGSELPYTGLPQSDDDTQLVNRVIITRVGGTEQVAEDVASQNEFLVSTYARTDLLFNNDASALNMAQWVLSLSAQPEQRFESIEIKPQRDETTLWTQVFNRLIGDRITIRRRPAGGGTMIEQDYFIRGIEHQATPGAAWITRWTLQSTASGGSFFIIGNATRGRLDLNPLGF
ncbi:hypothetical protein ACQEVF_32425 [Nonomuraea polychroma]|uniref:hypothetical protein n=1 Tax=Nonomuraea polychroma TaxID=46176 RepID=UPI003D8FB9B8